MKETNKYIAYMRLFNTFQLHEIISSFLPKNNFDRLVLKCLVMFSIRCKVYGCITNYNMYKNFIAFSTKDSIFS